MFRKNLHKMTYRVRGFMAFGPNDRCYVLNHGIVCDVVPILCMCVDIGMENNVSGGSFPFCRTEKPFSIFQHSPLLLVLTRVLSRLVSPTGTKGSYLVPVGDTIRDKVHAARHNVDIKIENGFGLFIQIHTLFMFKVFLNSKLILEKYKLIHF